MKDLDPHINIFLVDDQKITNFINRKLMNMAGIKGRVHDFTNPFNALEALAHYEPDLIILDLNMPQLNGWEFLEKMECYDTDAQVIIATSSTSNIDYQKAKTYNRVILFLIKPLNELSLKELVEVYETENQKKRLSISKSR